MLMYSPELAVHCSVIVAAAILGAASLAAGIYSAYKNSEATKEANEKNLDFQKQQFNYQKYLNQNQYQLQAADAMRAGINPIAMSGGSLQSGSFNANQQAADYSSIGDSVQGLASTLLSGEISRDINNDTLRAHQPFIDAQADKEQAQADLLKQEYDNNYELHQEQLKQARADSAIKQQELEIIKRKNQGQDDDGIYDGKPVSSESKSVKVGPVSLSGSSSGVAKSANDYLRSKDYGSFVSSKLQNSSRMKNLGSVDGDFDKNAVNRYSDEGFKIVGTHSHNGISYYLMANNKGEYLTVFRKK